MLSCQRLPSLSGMVQPDTACACPAPQPVHQPLWLPVQGRDGAGPRTQLNLPEPGLPSAELALSDTQRGDPKTSTLWMGRPSSFCQAEVVALASCRGAGRAAGRSSIIQRLAQNHCSKPRVEPPKGPGAMGRPCSAQPAPSTSPSAKMRLLPETLLCPPVICNAQKSLEYPQNYHNHFRLSLGTDAADNISLAASQADKSHKYARRNGAEMQSPFP